MTDASSIDVRLLQKGEEASIMEFVRRTFPESVAKHERSHWDWQYATDWQPEDGYLTVVAWDGDRVVGQRPMLPHRLSVHGTAVDAAWAPEFMVAPACRGKGVGSRLFKRSLEHERVYIAIQSASATLHIYSKLNAIRLPDVGKYVYPHSPDSALERSVKSAALRRALVPLGNLALAARHARYTGKRGPVTIVDMDAFDERFDRLWAASKTDDLILAERSSALLNWRFGRAPGGTYRIMGAESGGELTGYLVWREVSVGRFLVADIWSRDLDEDILVSLLKECLRRNQSAAGSQLTTCFGSHAVLRRAMERTGFMARKGQTMVVHPAESGVERDVLSRGDDWYVTAMGSDTDDIFRRHPYMGSEA